MTTEPFATFPELRRAHDGLFARLDEVLGGETDSEAEARAVAAIAPEIEAWRARAAASGRYLDQPRQRTSARSSLDYWRSRLRDAGCPAAELELEAFDRASLPDLPDEACPYVGLDSFRLATHFHGRGEDVARLLALVESTPVTLVFGASGSGKSSLLMAGLVPALDRSRWTVPEVTTPGLAPRRAISAALRKVGAIAEDLPEAGPLPPITVPNPLVLILDQAEEVFTLGDAGTQQALAELVAGLQAGGHRVLLGVREEFRAPMSALCPGRAFEVGPLSFEGLLDAILRPADAVGLVVDRGGAEELARKVFGQPAALPLLQLSLVELWRARDHNRLTAELLREADPLEVVKRLGEALWSETQIEDEDELRRLLLAMVLVNDLLEAYRKPVRRSDLECGRANTDRVLARLVERAFVRRLGGDADPVFEIRHEAFLRNWPRLIDWIAERRKQLRDRRALSQRAAHWDTRGRPAREGLLDRWELAQYAPIEGLDPVEAAYVRASAAALEDEERAELRRREEESARAAAYYREAAERIQAELDAAKAARQAEEQARREAEAGRIAADAARELAAIARAEAERAREAAEARRIAAEESTKQAMATGAAADAARRAAEAREAGAKRIAVLSALAATAAVFIFVLATVAVLRARSEVQLATREASLKEAEAVQLESQTKMLEAGLEATKQEATAFADRSLANTAARSIEQRPRLYIHFTHAEQRARAESLRDEFRKAGFEADAEEVPSGQAPPHTQVRYFHDQPAEAEAARVVADLIEKFLANSGEVESLLVPGYPRAERNALEIWFDADALEAPATVGEIVQQTTTVVRALDPEAPPDEAPPDEAPPAGAEHELVLEGLCVRKANDGHHQEVMIDVHTLAEGATRASERWSASQQLRFGSRTWLALAVGCGGWKPMRLWSGSVERRTSIQLDLDDHFLNSGDGDEVGEVWLELNPGPLGPFLTCSPGDDATITANGAYYCEAHLESHGAVDIRVELRSR